MQRVKGISALTFASKGGHAEIVTLLLAKVLMLMQKDRDGNTALIIATMYRRAEIVSLLLAKGVDVNARNNAGYTALIFAKKYAYAQIADILENWSYYTERVNRRSFKCSWLSMARRRLSKCSAKLPRDFIAGSK